MPATHLQADRARIARAVRQARATGDSTPVVDARRDYAAAAIADYVKRRLADAPPLTQAQRDRIAALLHAGEVRDDVA